MFNLPLKSLTEAKAVDDALSTFVDMMKDHDADDKKIQEQIRIVNRVLERLRNGETPNVLCLNCASKVG